MTPTRDPLASATGCLLGTAVADALGLPFEGMSPSRIAKLLKNKPLEHRFILGKGLCSDDTEHAAMTALALIESHGHPDAFSHALARRMKWWLARLPAGVGLATLRASFKLLIGVNPSRSGVRSAGNGPAMRAPIIGLYAADKPELLKELITRSTQITHNDTRALDGALLIAIATRFASVHFGDRVDPEDFLNLAPQYVTGTQLLKNTAIALDCARAKQEPQALLAALNLKRGVTGYINHTVPAALYCWFLHPTSFRDAIETSIRLGGDTDTVASITGAILGASLGPASIPPSWTQNLAEWPATTPWLQNLAHDLTQPPTTPPKAPNLPWTSLFARNTLFTSIVLTHAAKRLLPPY